MMDIFIIIAAGAARFAQGNGHAGLGRWLLLPIMLAAGWFGPLDGVHLFTIETVSIGAIAVGGWATVAFGYTEWGNWRYGLVRYSLPVLLPIASAVIYTGETWLWWYLLAGPALTFIYWRFAVHKPQWLINIVGDKDVASALAGVTVGALVLL